MHKHCDRLTRGKRVPTAALDDAEDVASSSPGPADVAEQRELSLRVRGAISELPDSQRIVTTLFYINGYSHQDIAGFSDVPRRRSRAACTPREPGCERG